MTRHPAADSRAATSANRTRRESERAMAFLRRLRRCDSPDYPRRTARLFRKSHSPFIPYPLRSIEVSRPHSESPPMNRYAFALLSVLAASSTALAQPKFGGG